MPVPTSTARRDRLISQVLADSLFLAAFPDGQAVDTYDPDGASETDGVRVAAIISGDGLGPGSLGDVGQGTDGASVQVVWVIYLYAATRNAIDYDRLINMTNALAGSLSRYQRDKTPGVQYWYSSEFVNRAPTGTPSSYHWYKANYYSVTVMNLFDRKLRN